MENGGLRFDHFGHLAAVRGRLTRPKRPRPCLSVAIVDLCERSGRLPKEVPSARVIIFKAWAKQIISGFHPESIPALALPSCCSGKGVCPVLLSMVPAPLFPRPARLLFVVQGPAFFLSGETDAEVSAAEKGFALTGLITCTILFIGYLLYQVCQSMRAGSPVFSRISVLLCIYLFHRVSLTHA